MSVAEPTASELALRLRDLLARAGHESTCKCGAKTWFLQNEARADESSFVVVDVSGLKHPGRPGCDVQRGDAVSAAAYRMELADDARRLLAVIRDLLRVCGSPSQCRACRRQIWWVVHVSKPGKKAAKACYTEQGLNHFADCPEADLFRRKRAGEDST